VSQTWEARHDPSLDPEWGIHDATTGEEVAAVALGGPAARTMAAGPEMVEALRVVLRWIAARKRAGRKPDAGEVQARLAAEDALRKAGVTWSD
jgi:hypothetical protein